MEKLERDQSAMGILAHLLVDVNEHEKERLLRKVIPDRFFELEETSFEGEPIYSDHEEKQANLSRCFRATFEMISYEGRREISRKFVEILRREDEHKVLTYETAFFQAGDLQYLSYADASLAKQHFLSRLTKSPSDLLLKASKGIAQHLVRDEVSPIVDALVRVVAYGKPRDCVEDARGMIVSLWTELPGGTTGLDAIVLSRLDDWIRHFKQDGQEDKAQIVAEIKSECDSPTF